MLKVGVVGLGYWGPNLARNFAACPLTTTAAVCDMDPARLEGVASQYPSAAACSEYADLLEKVDAVAVATPVATHCELARMALEAGKHVLVEKPMTLTVREARSLVSLAEEKGLVLAVDHTFLFTAAVRKMKEIVDSGELGEVWYLDSVRINLGLFQHDVNVVWDLAPHDLSIMDYLIGPRTATLVTYGAAHTPSGMADVAHIHLDFGGGLTAHFHVNWVSPVKIRRMIVGGSKKMVVFDDMDPMDKIRVYDRGIELGGSEEVHEALPQYRIGDMYAPAIRQTEALQVEVEEFAKAVLEGGPLTASGREGLRVVEILEASDRSLANAGRRECVG